MNKLIIIGNLTDSPKSNLVNTSNGAQTVCNFTVAVNRIVKGDKIAEYFRVTLWNKMADNAMQYLSKGSKVAVTGPVTASTYTGHDGAVRVNLEVQATEIEYLSSGANRAGRAEGQTQGAPQAANQPQNQPYQPQNQQYRQQGYQQPYQQYAQQTVNEMAQDGFMSIPPGAMDSGLPFR